MSESIRDLLTEVVSKTLELEPGELTDETVIGQHYALKLFTPLCMADSQKRTGNRIFWPARMEDNETFDDLVRKCHG